MPKRRLPAALRRQYTGETGDTFTLDRIAAAVKAAGADDLTGPFLIGITIPESGLETGIEFVNGDGSVDRGPWQINSKAWPNVTDQQAHNPETAAKAALDILRRQGKTAWVAYDQGKYPSTVGEQAWKTVKGTSVPSTPSNVPPPLSLDKPAILPAPEGKQPYYTDAEIANISDASKVIEGTEDWGYPRVIDQGTGEITFQNGKKQRFASERNPNPDSGDILRKLPIIGGPLGDISDGAASVADLAGNVSRVLFSVDFWKRVGVGAIGVLVALLGAILLMRAL